MRKLALLAVCVGAFLAMPGIAAADTAQGKLTGSGTIAPGGPTFDVHPQDPVIDGGTSYVGLENDKSGNCNGDSGTMLIRGDVFPVACAHYVASSRDNGHPKMRFAFQGFGDDYQGVRITDNGQSGDTVAFSPAFLTFARPAHGSTRERSAGREALGLPDVDVRRLHRNRCTMTE